MAFVYDEVLSILRQAIECEIEVLSAVRQGQARAPGGRA